MCVPRTHVYKTNNNKTELAVVEGTYNSSRRKVEAEGQTDPWGLTSVRAKPVKDSHENQDEGKILLEPTT